MKVLKFGGSSVATPARIQTVGNLLKSYHDEDSRFLVVFSAFRGITNLLTEMTQLAAKAKDEYLEIFKEFQDRHVETARELLAETTFDSVISQIEESHKTLKQLLKGIYLVREATPRSLDYVYSFGERSSCFIIAEFLKDLGLPAIYVDSRQLIKTDKSFGAAKVDFPKTGTLIKEWYWGMKDKIPVVTGFISSDLGGLTTTLGRGGSDYSAAIFASILQADVLEIWTDVDGVLTCDPKKVKKAYTIRQLSYSEAMELSHFGAKVIYPPTIQPALTKNIPIYIKNSFNPGFEGTYISKDPDDSTRSRIKGLSSITDISLLTIAGSGMLGVPGTAARLFSVLGRENINIIMITQGSSEHSICLAVKSSQVNRAVKAIRVEFAREFENHAFDPISHESKTCIIAIVGEKMKNIPGVAGRLFQALGRNGINVMAIAQGSSELNISFAIDMENEVKALNLIHDSFFLSDVKTVHLFIIGVGLIGGTLIKQISRQRKALSSSRRLKINIVGLANSKTMYFNHNGIDLSQWKELLDHSSIQSDISDFVRTMKEMNLPNSIFVDNTANPFVADKYLEILSANISVSTPNKIATSSSYAQFLALKRTAISRNVSFLFETTVGAGLPVISTLRNLIESGDQVIKIEAVLSGSLSFIFNYFKPGISFQKAVAKAMKLGLTEPDPREDLSGADMKRKIIILAREAGYPIEPEEVTVDNILPESCRKAGTVKEFLESLFNENVYFEELLMRSVNNNSVLRYMASFENGKASIRLMEIAESNPFYHINESDNMIAYTTTRYKTRPLIVKGPGAGSEVTAAGVFSEIITIGSTQYDYYL